MEKYRNPRGTEGQSIYLPYLSLYLRKFTKVYLINISEISRYARVLKGDDKIEIILLSPFLNFVIRENFLIFLN